MDELYKFLDGPYKGLLARQKGYDTTTGDGHFELVHAKHRGLIRCSAEFIKDNMKRLDND